MFERVDVQTITEDSVVVAFAAKCGVRVRAELSLPDHVVFEETANVEAVNRLVVRGLKAGRRYDLCLSTEGETWPMGTVATLPEPQGALRASYAVIADPHLAPCMETRRGRLFAEAPVLFREALREAVSRKVDFVLVPGDVTEAGEAEEYALADELLAGLPCPVLAVPGDHDVRNGTALFESILGPTAWRRKIAGLTVVGCDSSKKRLGDEGITHIIDSLPEPPGLTLLQSHLQFLPDSYIVDDDRAVADSGRFRNEVLPRLAHTTVAYIGHKNVPSWVRDGRFLQINVPQSIQYPCGWLYARVYDNGIYHNFEPIFSELLNESSRIANDALGVDKWRTEYRRGAGSNLWNNRVPF